MSSSDHDVDTDRTAQSNPDRTDDQEPTIEDCPPSAKLVYKVLEYEAPLTQEGIAAESRLCPRTVRYALGTLEESSLVASRVSLEDARQSQYWIPEGTTPGPGPAAEST
ncbi:MarR family transcriptional regulator [Natrarchaeobaculum aegyptiacum]|uniref:MarR family transcriptional regulator n=1 Tax=Natrarchaeobaculum aegyptiacum TaxID=745377 RepID=A0A2Z2HUH2_9EURY|nr:MarR family transcriptional regulator [Natrarchaeobaculum aegyptiacum]ARS88674.1 MarR family transcriptional regulator [Natrarchaeobaculum aegyptiacum]